MSLDAARSDSLPERLTTHEVGQRLQHERNSRLTQLEAIEQEGNDAPRELMIAQKTSIQRVLTEIDAAFARLGAGGYGLCQECRRPIPVERLEILPYARCCVGCQRRAS
ncbi:molecular chaperone DnaK [Streptomyces sp. Tu 2975]|uniref:TraR/DksA family transcriptional regulator n=1 Tax=Streptomyces sp. Tu 2975 TaxID=2676871 RepID=UPI00135A5265|nr:TraR/DksA C4-type zinc finger protein [Streptomyces sp. Tu 2975]QIP87954.1 molecular chaperone DnaK [Streptomyces sp. Tu 2975]